MSASPVYGKLQQHGELRNRTKAFALRVVKLCDALPARRSSNVIATQLLRAGTSLAANYRAAGQARSKAEFTAKICIVIEETDETVFWLEMLCETGLVPPHQLASLINEGNELLAIFSASRRTARSQTR
jgi:four helix bundle protein